MEQSQIVSKFHSLQRRCDAVGITLMLDGEHFCFRDIPEKETIFLKDLYSVDIFLIGYEAAYKISLIER